MAKYDFKGIKKIGAEGLRSALLTSPGTAWLVGFPYLTNFILEFIANSLANKGLIVLNLGAFYIEGELSQKKLDLAIDNALKLIKSGNKLTPEQIKEIDNEVIKAARNFIVVTRPK